MRVPGEQESLIRAVAATGKPLFPFGYGLSYTEFEYSDLCLDQSQISVNDSTVLRFKLTNTGSFDGDEVVQLYTKDLIASVARPVIELKGFRRTHLNMGETKEMTCPPRALLRLRPASFNILGP